MSLLFWKRRNDRDELLAMKYQEAFVAGRVMAQMGEDCPPDRPEYPDTEREAQDAGFFDGWISAEREIRAAVRSMDAELANLLGSA